jgi:hypothetical protein
MRIVCGELWIADVVSEIVSTDPSRWECTDSTNGAEAYTFTCENYKFVLRDREVVVIGYPISVKVERANKVVLEEHVEERHPSHPELRAFYKLIQNHHTGRVSKLQKEFSQWLYRRAKAR